MPARQSNGGPVAGGEADSRLFKRDPGGNFRSDAHRRLLGKIRGDKWSSGEEIYARLDDDPHVPLGTGAEDTVKVVLDHLIADGYVEQGPSGYRATSLGVVEIAEPPVQEEVDLEGLELR